MRRAGNEGCHSPARSGLLSRRVPDRGEAGSDYSDDLALVSAAQLRTPFWHSGLAPKRGYSAATPAWANMSWPSPSTSTVSLALACLRRSKFSHTSFQLPRVAALEYSVARVSKKLACSTPFS